jgi:hypothetical protein
VTCIVGLVDQESGDIWMGGDSAGASGHHLQVRAQPKVFRKGSVVMGYTSSFRMGQLLQYKLQIPSERDAHDALIEPFEWMVTRFVEAIRTCLKDGGFAKKKDEVEEGGTFLVGYRGRAYELGALDVLTASGAGPEHTVLRALEAAERFSGAVAEPFCVVRLPRAA